VRLARLILDSYWQVVNTVREWPLALQVNLAQSIIRFISESSRLPKKRNAYAHIPGRLKTDKPAPTDEEVRQMLEKAHRERYDAAQDPD
jgi:hypothetical protein